MEYLAHHGIKGQRWGVRRYQNEDGSLTEAGRKKYGKSEIRVAKRLLRTESKSARTSYRKAIKEAKRNYRLDTQKGIDRNTAAVKKMKSIAESKKKYDDVSRKSLEKHDKTITNNTKRGKEQATMILDLLGGTAVSGLVVAGASGAFKNKGVNAVATLSGVTLMSLGFGHALSKVSTISAHDREMERKVYGNEEAYKRKKQRDAAYAGYAVGYMSR